MFRVIVRSLIVLSAFLAFGVSAAFTQESTVKVRVSPPEAYIFVDGQPFAHRSQTIALPTGEHTIGVYNYGYVPQVESIRLEPGRNPEIVARLKPIPEMVKGPWGRLQIEGNRNDKAAVFINGLKPEFFVGHVDEMNNEVLATQKLVLPVGTYDLFIVNPKENEPFFTDKIEIRNNERLVVRINNKTHEYHAWRKAGHQAELQRFQTSPGTASIAVAPVVGNLDVSRTDIKCGEPVQLSWTSKEAGVATIAASPADEVPLNGQRTESPLKTTTYTFEAKGPGGVVTDSHTVRVDPTVQTALMASPAEVHYRRIDDKVIVPGTTTLTWTADNAQMASVDPLGTVSPNGNRDVAANPKLPVLPIENTVAVDEMETYALVASNNCGGQDKSLAAVHVVGTIEPLPTVPLASIFFPTAYPTEKRPEIGLLKGEQEKLAAAVAGFNRFLEYDPLTKIQIIAFADHRSSNEYNMALSERRANLIKTHLIALGVNESKIEMVPKGEEEALTNEEVANFEGKTRVPDRMVHAFNRRVDIVMVPAEKPQQASVKEYPHEIKGAKLLSTDKFQGTGAIERLSDVVPGTSASGQQ
jgi:hypothetical protein